MTPYPYYTGGGVGGQGGIKMASAKKKMLISSDGPHFRPRSTATTNGKSTNLRNIGIYWYGVVSASVYSEKTRMKKLMMMKMIIIIIMNKLPEMTFFHGRQKLTSAMKQRPEK